MKIEDVGSMPVCENRRSRKLIGIVTDRDLALHIVAENRDADATIIEHVMTSDPITCFSEDDLDKATHLMQSHQIRRIPVVDHHGNLIGIISQADIATRSEKPEKTAETVEEISRPRAA
jgi:CBS domain-containing protein